MSYRDRKITPTTLEKIQKIKEILISLGESTVRRILYVMYLDLGKKALKNKYQTIIKLCVRGRLAKIISWDLIKEKARQLHDATGYDNIKDFIESYTESFVWRYSLTKRPAHKKYFEVWLEKETLEDDFLSICRKYDAKFLALKGQSSWTALKKASDRMKNLDATILYFGDNDFYGNRMYKQYKEFLAELDCYPNFIRVALTDQQERMWKLPKGAKIDGSPMNELLAILENSIIQFINQKKFKEIVKQEEKDKIELEKYEVKIVKA